MVAFFCLFYPMLLSSLFAFLHFIFAFGVISSIIYEKILLKKQISRQIGDRIRKVDGFYGLSAILVLVIGFARVLYFEKGSEFYFSNPFFHLKLGLFVVIGLLSIYPTIRFMKWKKLFVDQETIALPDKEFLLIRRILNSEIALSILLLLSASLMAKGLQL